MTLVPDIASIVVIDSVEAFGEANLVPKRQGMIVAIGPPTFLSRPQHFYRVDVNGADHGRQSRDDAHGHEG